MHRPNKISRMQQLLRPWADIHLNAARLEPCRTTNHEEQYALPLLSRMHIQILNRHSPPTALRIRRWDTKRAMCARSLDGLPQTALKAGCERVRDLATAILPVRDKYVQPVKVREGLFLLAAGGGLEPGVELGCGEGGGHVEHGHY